MNLLRKRIDTLKNILENIKIDKKEYIKVLIQLAELLLTQNVSEEVEKYVFKLILLVEEEAKNNPQNGIEIYEIVAKYYQQKKVYKKAFCYLEKAFQLTKKQNSAAYIQQQIQAANQQTNQRISQVSNIVAHSFNTHLNHIEGVMEILQFNDSLILDVEASEYLQVIEDSVVRLRDKLKIMMIYAGIGSEDKSLKLLNLKHILFMVKNRLDEKIMHTNAKVMIGKLPQILAHPKLIRQLFYELIDNAIKFRKISQNPIIEVKYFSQNKNSNSHHFAICDNGIGIGDKYKEQIFLPYKQLTIPGEENRGSLRIGLSICKKIIQSYGGNIWVESEIGKGTCFHFTIPKF